MAIKHVFVGDIGTVFKATIKENGSVVDVSGATEKLLLFRRPDGTVLTKTASFFTDGSDGIITWTTVSGDLSVAGMWEWQGKVTLASSGPFSTEVKEFRVKDVLS